MEVALGQDIEPRVAVVQSADDGCQKHRINIIEYHSMMTTIPEKSFM